MKKIISINFSPKSSKDIGIGKIYKIKIITRQRYHAVTTWMQHLYLIKVGHEHGNTSKYNFPPLRNVPIMMHRTIGTTTFYKV